MSKQPAIKARQAAGPGPGSGGGGGTVGRKPQESKQAAGAARRAHNTTDMLSRRRMLRRESGRPGPPHAAAGAASFVIGGRTLHKTTLAACLASDPSYARGWVCDVCSVDMGTASEALWHAAPHEQESGGFDCCDACASKHRLLQLSKEELVERLLAAQAAAAVAVTVAPQAAVAAVAAPAPVATEMVLFRGQTLTRTNIAEVMRSEPQARYEAGWICDGCSTKSGNSAHVVIYHVRAEFANAPICVQPRYGARDALLPRHDPRHSAEFAAGCRGAVQPTQDQRLRPLRALRHGRPRGGTALPSAGRPCGGAGEAEVPR
jgi:hypothetical protein